MKITESPLDGVLVIEPTVFGDLRGSFTETYRADLYRKAGIQYTFVQDNLSVSVRGVLRGLHLQHPKGQAKLVYAVHGDVFDVSVDVRVGSPTFGRWFGVVLSPETGRQVLIPPGFAHGYCVMSERAAFAYKCSEVYSPETQLTVAWNDPAIGVVWPLVAPTLSEKDVLGLPLSALRERLPVFGAG
ncbi:MAG: dTDP-4-dehydrorhamnose 3,5-epimerase [Fimbriimonadaceae bacterium]